MGKCFAVLVVAALTIVDCAATSLQAQVRTWSDRQGRTVDAELVRVFDGQAVLKLRSGKIAKVPLASLSVADLDFLRKEQEKDGLRVWTDIEGRQVQAKFARVEGDSVFLLTDGGTSPVSFAKLSTADRIYVRGKLVATEHSKQLPPPGEDEILPAAREWNDVDGNSLMAQFDRAIPGKVLLSSDGMTRVVEIAKLSPADHDYLRERLEPQGLAHLVPTKPQPKPTEVATHSPPPPVLPPPVMPPPVVPPPTTPTPPTNPHLSQERLSSQVPSYREIYERDRHITAAPPPSVDVEPLMSEVFQCSNCNKEVPANLGAGNRCPHCGVKWDYAEGRDGVKRDARGNRVSPLTWGGATVGTVAGIAFMVFRLLYLSGAFDRK